MAGSDDSSLYPGYDQLPIKITKGLNTGKWMSVLAHLKNGSHSEQVMALTELSNVLSYSNEDYLLGFPALSYIKVLFHILEKPNVKYSKQFPDVPVKTPESQDKNLNLNHPYFNLFSSLHDEDKLLMEELYKGKSLEASQSHDNQDSKADAENSEMDLDEELETELDSQVFTNKMILSATCLNTILDIVPYTSRYFAMNGNLTTLCQKLSDLEYIDLAERILLIFEKLSHEIPLNLLRKSVLEHMMMYIDFFPMDIQISTLSCVLNVVRLADSRESFSKFLVPILNPLCSFLHSDSKKLVEVVISIWKEILGIVSRVGDEETVSEFVSKISENNFLEKLLQLILSQNVSRSSVLDYMSILSSLVQMSTEMVKQFFQFEQLVNIKSLCYNQKDSLQYIFIHLANSILSNPHDKVQPNDQIQSDLDRDLLDSDEDKDLASSDYDVEMSDDSVYDAEKTIEYREVADRDQFFCENVNYFAIMFDLLPISELCDMCYLLTNDRHKSAVIGLIYNLMRISNKIEKYRHTLLTSLSVSKTTEFVSTCFLQVDLSFEHTLDHLLGILEVLLSVFGNEVLVTFQRYGISHYLKQLDLENSGELSYNRNKDLIQVLLNSADYGVSGGVGSRGDRLESGTRDDTRVLEDVGSEYIRLLGGINRNITNKVDNNKLEENNIQSTGYQDVEYNTNIESTVDDSDLLFEIRNNIDVWTPYELVRNVPLSRLSFLKDEKSLHKFITTLVNQSFTTTHLQVLWKAFLKILQYTNLYNMTSKNSTPNSTSAFVENKKYKDNKEYNRLLGEYREDSRDSSNNNRRKEDEVNKIKEQETKEKQINENKGEEKQNRKQTRQNKNTNKGIPLSEMMHKESNLKLTLNKDNLHILGNLDRRNRLNLDGMLRRYVSSYSSHPFNLIHSELKLRLRPIHSQIVGMNYGDSMDIDRDNKENKYTKENNKEDREKEEKEENKRTKEEGQETKDIDKDKETEEYNKDNTKEKQNKTEQYKTTQDDGKLLPICVYVPGLVRVSKVENYIKRYVEKKTNTKVEEVMVYVNGVCVGSSVTLYEALCRFGGFCSKKRRQIVNQTHLIKYTYTFANNNSTDYGVSGGVGSRGDRLESGTRDDKEYKDNSRSNSNSESPKDIGISPLSNTISISNNNSGSFNTPVCSLVSPREINVTMPNNNNDWEENQLKIRENDKEVADQVSKVTDEEYRKEQETKEKQYREQETKENKVNKEEEYKMSRDYSTTSQLYKEPENMWLKVYSLYKGGKYNFRALVLDFDRFNKSNNYSSGSLGYYYEGETARLENDRDDKEYKDNKYSRLLGEYNNKKKYNKDNTKEENKEEGQEKIVERVQKYGMNNNNWGMSLMRDNSTMTNTTRVLEEEMIQNIGSRGNSVDSVLGGMEVDSSSNNNRTSREIEYKDSSQSNSNGGYLDKNKLIDMYNNTNENEDYYISTTTNYIANLYNNKDSSREVGYKDNKEYEEYKMSEDNNEKEDKTNKIKEYNKDNTKEKENKTEQYNMSKTYQLESVRMDDTIDDIDVDNIQSTGYQDEIEVENLSNPIIYAKLPSCSSIDDKDNSQLKYLIRLVKFDLDRMNYILGEDNNFEDILVEVGFPRSSSMLGDDKKTLLKTMSILANLVYNLDVDEMEIERLGSQEYKDNKEYNRLLREYREDIDKEYRDIETQEDNKEYKYNKEYNKLLGEREINRDREYKDVETQEEDNEESIEYNRLLEGSKEKEFRNKKTKDNYTKEEIEVDSPTTSVEDLGSEYIRLLGGMEVDSGDADAYITTQDEEYNTNLESYTQEQGTLTPRNVKGSNIYGSSKVNGSNLNHGLAVSTSLSLKVLSACSELSTSLCFGLEYWVQFVLCCPQIFSLRARMILFRMNTIGLSRNLCEYYTRLRSIPSEGDGDAFDEYLMDYVASNRVRLVDEEVKIPKIKLNLDRNNLLEDAMKGFEKLQNNPKLDIEYRNEVGIGSGPTLEFYTLISETFSNYQEPKLLEYYNGYYYPAPHKVEVEDGESLLRSLIYGYSDNSKNNSGNNSNINEVSNWSCVDYNMGNHMVDELAVRLFKLYSFLGKVFAYALLDEKIFNLFFHPLFWNLVKYPNKPMYLTLDTLRQVDPSLSESLQQIKNNPNPSQLYLTHEFQGYELFKGGSEVYVDRHNVEQYVQMMVDFRLFEGIKLQVWAFRYGFSCQLPLYGLWFFTDLELSELIFGNMRNQHEYWTMEHLKSYIVPDHGYDSNSTVYNDLITILHNFNENERRLFLKFTTGACILPRHGFKSLVPLMRVVKKGNVDELPSVMTCTNYLKMPNYKNQQVMKEKLLKAIYEGQNAFNLS